LSLNIIDFSDGIRPEEIQENFEMLQEQLNRERLAVGGYGIAYGFNMTPIVEPDRFAIRISEASIIDEDGTELFVPAQTIEIERPELYISYEHCTINYNNTISLKQIPYAAGRMMPAEYLDNKEPRYSGIYINYPSNNANTDDYIRVSDIKGTVLTVTGAISREVVVRYFYTADRIDTIYLKEDNTIGVLRGTTSTTPSKAYMPSDGKLLIGYVTIEHRHVSQDVTVPSAYITTEEVKSLRNLYTNEDNELFICGTPFDDLQIIHLREPKNPRPNTLWLNTTTNTLYYWKATDGFVYHNKIVIDKDFVENKQANRDFATYMDFLLDQNELEIYHNGNRLVHNIHYHELYNQLPTYNQNIPSDTEGNSFRIIEDDESGNGLTLKTGDVLTYMIRFKDSHYMWVPINKMTYVNAKEHKVYCTNDYMPDHVGGYFDSEAANRFGEFSTSDETPYFYKYQYFFFHREQDLNMLYTPGRNELSLMINQMPLHRDQFEEITIYDLLGRDEVGNTFDNKIPDTVAEAAAIHFGWTKKNLEDAANEYENTGIGFKLVDPLDCGLNANSHSYLEDDGSNDLYVEAIVERRVCGGPLKRKLQRSATFVAEETIKVDDVIKETGIINLKGDMHYRYNENQLEVYLNGKKLNGPSEVIRIPEYIEEYGYYLPIVSKGIDAEGMEEILYEEVIEPPIRPEKEGSEENFSKLDVGFYERHRAIACNMFKLNTAINEGDTITYRITTNVYSYDHVNDILNDLEARLDNGNKDITKISQEFNEFKNQVNDRVSIAEQEVQRIRDDVLSFKDEGYFDEYGVLAMSNMPPQIIQTSIVNTAHICTSFNYQIGKTEYVVTDIRAEDYLTIVKRDAITGMDQFLIPNEDYSVYNKLESGIYKSTVLIFNNGVSDNWNEGTRIIITGIKIGKAGR
jgi:hypothetical protein